MSLKLIIINTIELVLVPDSCMDVALVSGEGAVTMHFSFNPGTNVTAKPVDQCSLAVIHAIFELSDVVSKIIDVSAESGQLPIHE